MALDATVGTGRDTKALASIVGDSGRVFGFDVQSSALDMTRERLAKAGLMARVTLFEAGHERMAEFLPPSVRGRIDVAMFNLGYLPGGDHHLTTCAENTVAALTEALRCLSPGGLLTVMCYPGHPEGAFECRAVENWTKGLEEAFFCEWVDAVLQNPDRPSPRLLLIRTPCPVCGLHTAS